jgi:hypothetical protein
MIQSVEKIIENKFYIISKLFKDISFKEFNFIQKENSLPKLLIKDEYLFYYNLKQESEALSTDKVFREIEYLLNFELNFISDNNSVIKFFNKHVNEEYKSNFNIFNILYRELNEIYKLKKITTSFNFDLINNEISNTILASITILDKIECVISFTNGSINYIDIILENSKKDPITIVFFSKINNFSIENINSLIVKKLFKFLNYENEIMDQKQFLILLSNHYDDLIKLSSIDLY